MRHRKFARLARLIGSKAVARGALEMLWDVAYENGDDLMGDAKDVEFLAEWEGESGLLASALVEAGFLDLADGQYRVHDLYDHAPEYVRKRLDRELARRDAGKTLRDVRAEAARSRWQDKSEQPSCKRQPLASVCNANGTPPAPAPAPAPITSTSLLPAAAAEKPDLGRLWAIVQSIRTEYGLDTEGRSPKAWARWLSDALSSLGGGGEGEARLLGAYRRFLSDFKAGKANGLRSSATSVFMAESVWRSRLPSAAPPPTPIGKSDDSEGPCGICGKVTVSGFWGHAICTSCKPVLVDRLKALGGITQATVDAALGAA
jgi:hypothetical protein